MPFRSGKVSMGFESVTEAESPDRDRVVHARFQV